MFDGCGRIGREKRDIGFLKVFRPHILDERGFVADGVQLSFGFVVEQLDLRRGKVTRLQNFLQLFALECGGSDDGYAIEVAAHANPEDCGSCTSVVALDCGFERRSAKNSRASTPESM